MNAATPYELYRVITDYEALQDGFLDRIEDLNTTLEQIELAGELPKGYAAKLLCKSTKRVVKALGPHSLGKMLKGTGLVLALVVDDVRFQPIKEQLVKRRRVNNAKPVSKQVLRDFKADLFRSNGRLGGKRRLVKLSKRQRTLIAKAGASARWSKKRTRKCVGLPVASS